MGSKDFNLFMDNYIDGVRSKKKSPKMIIKNKDSEIEESVPVGVSSNSIYIIRKPKNWWQNLVQLFTSVDEEDFEEKKKKEKKVSIDDEQEFEQELDEMEQEQNKKGFFSKLFSLFSSDVNEAYEDLDDEANLERDVNESDIPKAALIEDEVVADEQKVSLWQRFLNFFGVGFEETYEDDQEESTKNLDDKNSQFKDDPSLEKMIEIKDDMKQIAIIATAAFKKLPQEQFKLFKESSDFSKFKSILSKHNIIKLKE
jgi:hypothetical protein